MWRVADSPASASRSKAGELPAGVQYWRGVRDPAAAVWLVRNYGDGQVVETLAKQHNISPEHIRKLKLIREWGEVFDEALPIANFVLREMQDGSSAEFVPKLYGQIAKVIARPGCFGQILAAEVDAPDHLLGVTYWEAERSFAQYADWAGKHVWKNTVDPVTSSVPLRLLTRRVEFTPVTEG
jgi:hypothetical protein